MERKSQRFVMGRIYMLEGGPVDDDYPEFDHVKPAMDDVEGLYIVDCWVCNEYGDICPGYSESPVPIHISDFAS